MMTKIKQIMNEDDGIFKYIQLANVFQWLSQTDATNLDLEYVFSHSPEKPISTLYENVIKKYEDYEGDIDNIVMVKLANLIVTKYGEKWNRIHLALISAEYNPIENYDSHETETPNIVNIRTIKTKTKLTTTNNNDGFGFNNVGTEGVPVSKIENVVEGDDTKNQTSDTNWEQGSRTIERHGNIGVTTNQQMITQEIEMRDKYILFDIMMNDVDALLTLNIYE